jgi:hypothetical protein
VSDALYDVQQEQYRTVIREMIRHENDVTNHCTMWLLVGQGFIANAYIMAMRESASTSLLLPLGGILVTLSAFLLLYKSYQARGYLQFLGTQAKKGTLQEEHLPLVGWPRKRIKGWWRVVWVCRWFGQPGDLVEPWLFLPYLFVLSWLATLLKHWITPGTGVVLILAAILSAVIFSVFCIVLVWSQGKDEESIEELA